MACPIVYPDETGRVVVGGPGALTVLQPRPEAMSAYDVVFHRRLDPVEGGPVPVQAVARDNGELIDCTPDGRVRITTPRVERGAGPAAPAAPGH